MKALSFIIGFGLLLAPACYANTHIEDDDLLPNGSSASTKDYPFAVYVRTNTINDGGESCIGAFLTNEFIVTESICVVNPETDEPVPVSDVDISYGNSSRVHQIPATIVDIIYDYEFSGATYKNNVALIKIEPIKFSDSVNRIPVYSGGLRSGEKLVSASWGDVNDNLAGTDADKLFLYNQKIGSDYQCAQSSSSYLNPNGRIICTFNSVYTDLNVCNGGGIGKLLLKEVDNTWHLVGISTDRKYQLHTSESKDGLTSSMEMCMAEYTALDFIRIYKHVTSFSKTTGLDPSSFGPNNNAALESDSSSSGESGSTSTEVNTNDEDNTNDENNDNDNADRDDRPSTSVSDDSAVKDRMSRKSGLSTGAIAGIIIGSIAALILIILAVAGIIKHNRRKTLDKLSERCMIEISRNKLSDELGNNGASYIPSDSQPSISFKV